MAPEIVEQRYRAAGLSYGGHFVLRGCGRRDYRGGRQGERNTSVRANAKPPIGN